MRDHHSLTHAADLLLRGLGEDPTREGLRRTPERLARALLEMTSGWDVDVAALLAVDFDAGDYDQMIVAGPIEFHSLCEHHLLPFRGEAWVGYLPDRRVVGLSKLARLVDAFARRLQVQERMTAEIAGALVEYVRPAGVGVMVRAHHLCMGARGVRKPGTVMVTQALLGEFRSEPAVRAEFLSLARGGVTR